MFPTEEDSDHFQQLSLENLLSKQKLDSQSASEGYQIDLSMIYN